MSATSATTTQSNFDRGPSLRRAGDRFDWHAKHHARQRSVHDHQSALPDGSYDAETLLADPLTGDLSLSPRAWPRIAFIGPALRTGSWSPSFARSLNFTTPSGGDISADGSEIVIRNEDIARLYVRSPGQSIAQALASAPFAVPVIGTPEEPNGEAIGFFGWARLLHDQRRTSPPSLPTARATHRAR